MGAKKSKTIKRLKRQVKKLDARIDELKADIKLLKKASVSSDESEQLFHSDSKFTQEEVELAEEMTDDAEAVLDLLDKS